MFVLHSQREDMAGERVWSEAFVRWSILASDHNGVLVTPWGDLDSQRHLWSLWRTGEDMDSFWTVSIFR